MKGIASVIERLKEIFEAKNNTELAEKLNIPRNTVSTWKNRGSVPYAVCIDVAEQEKVSLDWLLAGIEPMKQGIPSDKTGSDVHFEMDVELMGKIMSIFMDAAQKSEVYIPPHELGQMVACIYQDMITDWPSREERLKALKMLTGVASNICNLYEDRGL